MADQALLAQLTQLACQLNALQQTDGNLQASNTTLNTRIATLEAENNTLTIANTTLMAQILNLSGGTVAGDAFGGDAGAAAPVTFVATPGMVNHQDLIDYTTKLGTMIYDEGCKKLTTEHIHYQATGQVCQDGVAHEHPAKHQLYQRRWLHHQHCQPVWPD
jgi:hypothetical protein